ncbi:MAG: GlmU family protein [Bacteroidota bacterium]
MNVILFDDPVTRVHLLPLTFTRPVAGIRIGTLTIAEKWQKWLGESVSFATLPYLAKKFPAQITADNYWINGALCPDRSLVENIRSLKPGEGIRSGGQLLAMRNAEAEPPAHTNNAKDYPQPVTFIDHVWKIFQRNGEQIRADFALLTQGRTTAGIGDKHTVVYNPGQVFVEEGVITKAAILNAETGPIYLGRNAQVQEGAVIRGPFSLGEESVINMGGKMRGDTTIGPYCKVGGEISNAVIFGYSNKGHDGFLGNSVLGEWCNLGADTNTSNLKNNYDHVKLWSYATEEFIDTGAQFCGLIMGDHSKSGINTMFNTGTVVGVSANIFGAGYPRNFIPSFSWGGPGGLTTYQINKALDTAERMASRRNVPLTDIDKEILHHIFNVTASYREREKR